jgi:predicted metal-dependent HD superfamily phosphohydrolase
VSESRAPFACRHQPVAVPDDVAAALASAYGEPGRAYHDARHIGEVLGWFDVVADEGGWERPAEVFVALLFHDVVYDPLAAHGSNEATSAWRARAAIANHEAWRGVDGERVAQLIELTARHTQLAPGDVDDEAARFLDCDLSILAAAPDRFDEYERGIAREYAVVPRDAYRAGRRAFLAKAAAAPRLFLSDFFHARLDGAARANLTRALAMLAS